MKKNAFTLVELLAVLVILGVVMLIVFPFVLNSYNKASNESYQAQVAYVRSSAEVFVQQNKHLITELSTINTPYTVTVKYLYDHNYLELPIKNALTNKDIDPDNSVVKITRVNEATFNYEVTFK